MVYSLRGGQIPPLVIAAIALVLALPAEAAQRQPAPSTGRQVSAERGSGSAPSQIADDPDAQDTRERLQNILGKYPPTVAMVLRLDPTLLGNDAYLAPYPALAAFLAQHPQVSHNPSYFFGNVRLDTWDPRNDRRQAYELLGGVLAGLAVFSGFVLLMAALGWLIRTIVNYRRWNRLSKVQTDVHTKLLDRFTANEDLLSYMQTAAGKRFLESAPIPLDSETRSIGAPLSRILWSAQAGVVLGFGALGLLFVSGRATVDEIAQPLFAIGIVGLALGAGFVVSAFVSYLMSRRLGLIESTEGPAPGTAAQPGA